jgi:hypothetical protein
MVTSGTDPKVQLLVQARQQYEKSTSKHYDEVLTEVTARAETTGSLGKADIGANCCTNR